MSGHIHVPVALPPVPIGQDGPRNRSGREKKNLAPTGTRTPSPRSTRPQPVASPAPRPSVIAISYCNYRYKSRLYPPPQITHDGVQVQDSLTFMNEFVSVTCSSGTVHKVCFPAAGFHPYKSCVGGLIHYRHQTKNEIPTPA
jgi:hypothetical protein